MKTHQISRSKRHHFMEDLRSAGLKLPLIYGLVTGVLLIAFFMTMVAVGLVQNIEYRLINAAFVVLGCGAVLYKLAGGIKPASINYFRGLIASMSAGLVGVTLFSIFIYTYLKFDPLLVEHINSQIGFGPLSPSLMAVSVLMEGSASVLIICIVMMQYFKKTY